MPICGLLSADDERVGGAVCAIEEAADDDSPRMRYRNDQAHDGMEGGEGNFITCGFWLAHMKLREGQRDEAESRVRRLLSSPTIGACFGRNTTWRRHASAETFRKRHLTWR